MLNFLGFQHSTSMQYDFVRLEKLSLIMMTLRPLIIYQHEIDAIFTYMGVSDFTPYLVENNIDSRKKCAYNSMSHL